MLDKDLQALNIIRDAYDKLMSRQFFFYNIASQFALKAVDKKLCRTMGVAHIDGAHWLIYNSDFVNLYTYEEMSVILEHEIHHFTFDHVKSFDSSTSARPIFKPGEEEQAKDYVRNTEKEKYLARLRNTATDRSINIHLFGLANHRSRISDIKEEFVDEEGRFHNDKYEEYMQKSFAKGDAWFKDQSTTLDNYTDESIVEGHLITEFSFKKTLKEAGYQPTQELKDLWTKSKQLKKDYAAESENDEPSQDILDGLKAQFESTMKEFHKLQEPELAKVKKYSTWEYYFDLLLSCPETEEALKSIKEMDVHFGDEDGDGEGGRQAQEARDKVMMEAARNSNKHDIPGNLRDHIRSLFDKYSKEAALPWNVILRRLVNSAKKSVKKNDVNSRNKYAPGEQILPGYKLDPVKDIAVIWDVSGSCMDEETQTTFIKECNAMIKSGSIIEILYTDRGVEHRQICDKQRPLKAAQYEVTGGGGTDMDPAILEAIKKNYKIIINLTDCYVPYALSKSQLKGRKVITVSTTDHKAPAHYGPTIQVNRK